MALTWTRDDQDRRLLETATGLAGTRRIPELLPRLKQALELGGEAAVAGLGVHDHERRLFVYHAMSPARGALEMVEVPAEDSEAHGSEVGEQRARVLRLEPRSPNAFHRTLAQRGLVSLVSVPLFGGERTLGSLFVGLRVGELDPEGSEYLTLLAKLVEPHVWNCFVDERFARGDRRRDALRELSSVINSSLDPRVVLHLARSALGAIEGHRWSCIGLIDSAGGTWKRHDRPHDYRGDGEEPQSRPIAGSVLERVLRAGKTIESGDLASSALLADETELLTNGVRRYVATPLRAGGKLLGAFLFGSDDPRPPLPVDVWLIENTALQIALALANALHHDEILRLSARREQQNSYLREEIKGEHTTILGRSNAMRRVFEQIARVATTDASVLISGPTGVGKELVARAIHEASPQRDQPMVKLNCAAIPEGMVESELFGHERGAFTSAVDRRIGRFELAHGGTLFLDEVGELSLAVQAKLLRVLQSGEFERVGGSKTLTSNARILAATNRDLARTMANGGFRSDLYYRLNVFPIFVPALEERREDIPLLAAAFLEQLARRMGKRIEGFAPAALEYLRARSWPGNVRELRHVIERAAILCDGPLLTIEEESAARRAGASPEPLAVAGARLEAVEAAHICATLEHTGWVIEGPRGAAAILGLNPSTLRFRMKRLGIQRVTGNAALPGVTSDTPPASG
ncbi:MAG: sigma 54-interacting transcriptional regulator [Planctomycetes bacterium]|nr:sigma 54-interacting transcriptional regulator [Planctomycetota bacterium]